MHTFDPHSEGPALNSFEPQASIALLCSVAFYGGWQRFEPTDTNAGICCSLAESGNVDCRRGKWHTVVVRFLLDPITTTTDWPSCDLTDGTGRWRWQPASEARHGKQPAIPPGKTFICIKIRVCYSEYQILSFFSPSGELKSCFTLFNGCCMPCACRGAWSYHG